VNGCSDELRDACLRDGGERCASDARLVLQDAALAWRLEPVPTIGLETTESSCSCCLQWS
jgi:hypothetical protein